MYRRRCAAAICALALAAASGAEQAPSGRPPAPAGGNPSIPSGIEISSIDHGAEACTDFYAFACGGWMAAHQVPPDRQQWGRAAELQERNLQILKRILETPATDGDRRKASDYYAACMDERAIEGRGLRPIAPELARIAALARKEDLPALIAHLHGIGVNVFFRFGAQTDLRDAARQVATIDQGGLGMPDRDYYLKADTASAELKRKYQDHVQVMLGLLGDSPQEAAAGARAVLAIETALAAAETDRVRRRDPATTDHVMTLAEWHALTPDLDWAAYVTTARAPRFETLNVAAPEFLAAMDAIIKATPIADLQAYLRWQLVNASADLLPRRFADAAFDFFSRTLGGQQTQLPRWQRCVADVDEGLGEALGKAFVEDAFGATAKDDTLALVQGIRGAMKQDIQDASWMTEETKRAAQTKLNAVVDRIGYPDRWRDYRSLRVTRGDALGNRQRGAAFERARTLNKIGRAVDRGEWGMTPPTVNAYYSPARNTINFPAGILQPPFYRAGRDAAVNYGAAGSVIGHELTHGFDDQGRKFDGQGNLRNWWTDLDAKAYDGRASCIADQYSQYVVTGDTHINGRLTLGENTADNGGLRLALMAYLTGPRAAAQPLLDGFTPEQRFFIGYAQVWCENRRPEFERLRAATDPHSSARFRVDGVVSNMPEFQAAFACKADAPMVRREACRVW